MSQLVLIEETETSAKLTLNRPDQHNALVPELLAELNTHLAALSNRHDLQSVVLAANGRSFSTGGDVRGFRRKIALFIPNQSLAHFMTRSYP